MAGAKRPTSNARPARKTSPRLTTVEADGRRVFIAPGFSYQDEAGLPDVMRGEETEIFGVADLAGAAARRAARLAFEMGEGRGRPRRAFKTFVSGELFAALRDHTIAGAFAKAAPAKAPGEAFALGVERGAAAASGKANPASRPPVRRAGLPLMGALARTTPANICPASSSARKSAKRGGSIPGKPHVAGAEALVKRYLAAFEALGVGAARAAARRGGLFRIAREGGLPMKLARADAAGCDPSGRAAGRRGGGRRRHRRGGIRRDRGSAQFARPAGQHRENRAAVRRPDLSARHGARAEPGR